MKLDEYQEKTKKYDLGDVLWYVAAVARYLDEPLSGLATQNIEKLESRHQCSQLAGSGDNR